MVSPRCVDGFRLDEDGNVWTSAADGVHCVSPERMELGRITVPFTVSDLTFGGRNRSRLFICASHTLFAIYTNQRGVQRPRASVQMIARSFACVFGNTFSNCAASNPYNRCNNPPNSTR